MEVKKNPPIATAPVAAGTPVPASAVRLRLLPLLMLAILLVLTVRVGGVWQQLSIGIGSETRAQTAPPASAPTPEPIPAPTAAPASGDVPAPVAEGEAEPAETAAALPEKDPLEYTDEEVEVLQQLAKRREELELRWRQLDEREAMVAAAEQRMEQKMAELKALQTTVEDLLKKRSDEEEARLQSLVKIYENMKPKSAAKVFEELDMDVLLEVASRMNERKLAPILALVSPTKAKEMTYELAQQQSMPFAP
jgi:flagellar motility protein MotE (MotC chaperone)